MRPPGPCFGHPTFRCRCRLHLVCTSTPTPPDCCLLYPPHSLYIAPCRRRQNLAARLPKSRLLLASGQPPRGVYNAPRPPTSEPLFPSATRNPQLNHSTPSIPPTFDHVFHSHGGLDLKSLQVCYFTFTFHLHLLTSSSHTSLHNILRLLLP